MSSGSTENRATAVSMESLLEFWAGETDIVLRRFFWLIGYVFLLIGFLMYFFGGGKVQVEKDRVELEKRGREMEKAHAGYEWSWFCFGVERTVQLGLVEEVDEIFLDGGDCFSRWVFEGVCLLFSEGDC